jgi:hypothetical protein
VTPKREQTLRDTTKEAIIWATIEDVKPNFDFTALRRPGENEIYRIAKIYSRARRINSVENPLY